MDSQIDDIDAFLSDYAPYFRRLTSGKIECVLNGHQLKPDGELLRNLVKYITHISLRNRLMIQREEIPEAEAIRARLPRD